MTKAETISAIKLAPAAQPTAADLVRWRQDDRIGVQKLLDRYEKGNRNKLKSWQPFRPDFRLNEILVGGACLSWG